MEILSSPFLLLVILVFHLYLFVRYGGTQIYWLVRLWCFHTAWEFLEYILDSLNLSESSVRILNAVELAESFVFLILLVLIFLLDNKRYGGIIFKYMKLKGILLLALVVAILCWFLVG